jgi:outer membrane receptor protein involved in Fe transport
MKQNALSGRVFAALFFLSTSLLTAQNTGIKGQLQSPAAEAVGFATLGIYLSEGGDLKKAGASDESGIFELRGLDPGVYVLKVNALGFGNYLRSDIRLEANQLLDLGVITLSSSEISLDEVTVTASRVMVEIKPDRTIFNVDGTINSAGSDGMTLLRKAPNVTVDNNDNISVLGRSGVLLYVDGKRMPLTGADLTSFLQNLPAEQVDRIEIITNPGAKYEAEGNAGIIDIRLKRDQNLGANGSVNTTASQGIYHKANLSGSVNYRNKTFNAFANAGLGNGTGFHNMTFFSRLNGMVQDEINNRTNDFTSNNYRAGIDFFLGKKHTLGLLVSGGDNQRESRMFNRITIAQETTPDFIDSILVANSTDDNHRKQQTYNLNYRFDNADGRTLNIDLDYGAYRNGSLRYQPNQYYTSDETGLLTLVVNSFDTPSDIDIYTFTTDFEDKLWGGTMGAGVKYSKVVSDNTFLVYDEPNGIPVRDNRRSNRFRYDEQVYAGYVNYARPLGKKWQFSAGLRAELTDAMGNLKAFLPELEEPPVLFNYLSWFPSAGLTWELSEQHSLAFNGGRRINRPDYNVLNPFNNQMSQLSYEKGNPFLRPEIVNNLELGYTLAHRYNLKLAYSKTTDQITRLIAPDEVDPRAGFITWDNLASQTILSVNVSAPVQIAKWWNAYFNGSASHINNQADYGDGGIVDVQAFSYTLFQQHTFDLPWALKGEISGYYSGPGVWGGVFLFESNWGLNLGLQRKFLRDRLNVRLAADDIFYETGWDGYSDFNGLYSAGGGRWDSRRVSLSLGYRFGNDNVKSRRRSTGLEAEAGRVGGE